MRCRNCSNEVPPGPTCVRCGLPLEADPSAAPAPLSFHAPPGAEGPSSLPLTTLQRARLLLECLPLLFFVLALAFALTILDDITGAPPPSALPLFLGFVVLVMGWTAINRMRDLISGVALVREDRLLRAWRSRGSSGSNSYRGTFEQLGGMRLASKAWGQGQPGARHRLIYSPASKIVWSLEQLR